tara:strand:- start:8690 stop:9109 length:420 start_codon:yes stop_codon:yes gene_type:complete
MLDEDQLFWGYLYGTIIYKHMKKIIFFGLLFFLGGTNVNAQQFSKLANPQDNEDLLEKSWSVHEDNVLKRRKTILKDTIVFDFNYKDQLGILMDNQRSKPILSQVKAVEMPNVKPSGNYPMTIYPNDTTATYAARIYKY